MVTSYVRQTKPLDEAEILATLEQGLRHAPVAGKRVLIIIPDHTRSGPTGVFFRCIAELLRGRASAVDFLIALGTHPPLSEERINALLSLTPRQRAEDYGFVRIFNHAWDDPTGLAQVGTLHRGMVEELSQGLLSLDVPVLLNKRVLDYDHLIIAGPVFPHEVAGFSGGHKYLFPGVAAPAIIHFTHWLGALVTNPKINGHAGTPVRAAIEAAAGLVPVPRTLVAYVVHGGQTNGLFVGPVREAWQSATELAAKIHILRRPEPCHTVLACAPAMYDDIWTAGKCMYKLEPVVADGGTLIIHAPHIDEVSYSHGKLIDEVGYHVRDYFTRQWDRFAGYPWGILAHSTHVKGIGSFDGSVEEPRVNVVLATGISPERCRQINLGYRNPQTIHMEEFANRESEGVLLVPNAGETLYQLEDMSRFN